MSRAAKSNAFVRINHVVYWLRTDAEVALARIAMSQRDIGEVDVWMTDGDPEGPSAGPTYAKLRTPTKADLASIDRAFVSLENLILVRAQSDALPSRVTAPLEDAIYALAKAVDAMREQHGLPIQGLATKVMNAQFESNRRTGGSR